MLSPTSTQHTEHFFKTSDDGCDMAAEEREKRATLKNGEKKANLRLAEEH